MSETVVAVNAHPDDEAILMGGTLAALAVAGHRVVLITMTRGEAGGASGERRMSELNASARALGAAQVIDLGYADSGMGPQPLPPVADRLRLHTVPICDAAARLACALDEAQPALVIGYDAAGGYGHRDHVSVHHITRAAVHQAGSPRLLEATAPRELILRAVRAGYRLRGLPGFARLFTPTFTPAQWADAFTPSAQITHRADVRAHVRAKRAAMRAHISQAVGGPPTDAARTTSAAGPLDTKNPTLGTVLSLPLPAYRWVFGREFFVEPGRSAPAPSADDALADLMPSPR